MTRIKKTRTSGQIGVRHKPATEARQDRTRTPETKKKGSGLKSGSRHSPPAEQKTSSGSGKKDPRHGSKTPIALVITAAEQKVIDSKNLQPVAQLSKAKQPTLSPEQELAQIENDATLAALLDRVDQGEILKGKEAKYFNAKTARHAELVELLGLDSEEEDEELDPLAKLEQTDWRKEILGED
ncbi:MULTISPECIES: Der GTPase-activating protein YihI [Rheinheimera]|uniref:Der GTPase-activating protein YihI n=1 Tax=Rheinheimera marina TaxID=1774958 RepID=A0ABV9JJD8_9GAMM